MRGEGAATTRERHVITPVVQRWREHRATYRPSEERGKFIPAHYEVAPLPEREARFFVEQHHYAGSIPAARWCFGLFWGGLLVGAVVFSHPMNDLVITSVLPGAANESVELGRLVLLDRVPANAESWLVARCFDLLRAEGMIGVVSFSDPVPRTDSAGTVLFRGHCGTVYQSLNAVYTGRGKARTLRLLPDGTVLSERAIQKARANERGASTAVKALVSSGAPRIDLEILGEEERRAWVRDAVACPP